MSIQSRKILNENIRSYRYLIAKEYRFIIKSTPNSNHIKFKDRKEGKYRPRARSSLTEKEKEQRRKEMMANAIWRDKEREKNVKIYREQEKKEEQPNTSYDKDFIRYITRHISP